MKCDLCSSAITQSEGVRISNGSFRAAVRRGFNPFQTPGCSLPPSTKAQLAMGVSRSELAGGWKQRALSDATDWVLCRSCEVVYSTAWGSKATPSAKWWQFWR